MASTSPVPPTDTGRWDDAILSNAAGNVPSFTAVLVDSRFTPPAVAAVLTFFILWWLRPPFVQAEQSGEFALPAVSYTTVLAISAIVFALVLGSSYFYGHSA